MRRLRKSALLSAALSICGLTSANAQAQSAWVAFEANTSNLWLYSSASGQGAQAGGGLGMATADLVGPASIAVMPDGSYEAAFQTNTHNLWIYSSASGSGTPVGGGLGMEPGTSPSIAALSNGSYVVAFQANTGALWVYSSASGQGAPVGGGLGMMPDTSPSIAATPDGNYVAAFQANTGNLWVYSSASGGAGPVGNGLGMQPGTSPSITVTSDGSYDVAFQANTSSLWVYSSASGKGTPVGGGLGMMPGTSPSVAAMSDGSYVAAFQANTSNLWVYSSASGSAAQVGGGLGMMPGTSPSIAAQIAATSASCGPTDNCTPQTFADAIFSYPGINAPLTPANEFAFETWERAEGGGAGCTAAQPADTAPWPYSPGPAGNPINTTLQEPGSTTWNSVGVQIYADGNGKTCWSWGIQATGDTLVLTTNSSGAQDYAPILNVLRSPSTDKVTQCINLARAVGGTPWGTGDFEADCQ